MIDMYDISFRSSGAEAGIVADASAMKGDVVLPVQTHSCNCRIIREDGCIPELDDTDALICLRRGVRIGVRTADCVPVVVYAPDIHAVAAVHAGWRGSLGGILSVTLRELVNLGADPAQMEAAFGPSICGKCYEVSEELAMQFAQAGFAECISGKRNVDLEAVNLCRLLKAGVPLSNITRKRCCTFETAELPSWRREETTSRLLTWITLS